jgi:acetyl-CoA acetyltransferase
MSRTPDIAIIGLVGMTGLPARVALSGCTTGNSLLTLAARDVALGEADIAIGVGPDKHPRGAFRADPSVAGLPQGRSRPALRITGNRGSRDPFQVREESLMTQADSRSRAQSEVRAVRKLTPGRRKG